MEPRYKQERNMKIIDGVQSWPLSHLHGCNVCPLTRYGPLFLSFWCFSFLFSSQSAALPLLLSHDYYIFYHCLILSFWPHRMAFKCNQEGPSKKKIGWFPKTPFDLGADSDTMRWLNTYLWRKLGRLSSFKEGILVPGRL